MKFCINCGTQIDDNAQFCPACGAPQQIAQQPGQQQSAQQQYSQSQYGQYQYGQYGQQQPYQKPVDPSDAPSTGFGVLGFLFPLVGFILWLVWKDTMPQRAKSTGKGALIGVIVSFALEVLIIALSLALASAGLYYAIAPMAALLF